MDTQPSTHDTQSVTNEQLGVPRMELTKSQELIKQLKEIKETKNVPQKHLDIEESTHKVQTKDTMTQSTPSVKEREYVASQKALKAKAKLSKKDK